MNTSLYIYIFINTNGVYVYLYKGIIAYIQHVLHVYVLFIHILFSFALERIINSSDARHASHALRTTIELFYL